jgi:hypothetical protein
MRIIVPAADEDSRAVPTGGLTSSPKAASFEVAVTPTGLLTKAAVLKSAAGYQKIPAVLQKQMAFQETGADICWDSQNETTTQDKARSHKLWKPWGSSKKETAVTEKIVEEVRVCILPAAPPEDDASCEERRAMSIDRAATPWEPQCDHSLLEESIGSDVSSIPGFMDADDAQDAFDGAQDTSLDAAESSPDFTLDHKCVDSIDHEDDCDSGIDETVSEWKLQENQSPSQKKSRFNRFISSVQAPKFWRAPKGQVNDVVATRIEVAPSFSNPDPVIDLD